jgi:hypothetical protein
MANYTYNYNYKGKRTNLAIEINFAKLLEATKTSTAARPGRRELAASRSHRWRRK